MWGNADIHGRRDAARRPSRFWAATLLLLTGCASFTQKSRAVTNWLTDDPVPEQRSIQELYYEALEASALSPENTITPYDPASGGKPYIDGGPSGPLPAPPADPNRPTLFQAPGQPLALQTGTAGEHSAAVLPASGRGLGPRVALTSGNDAGALVSEIFEGTDIRQAVQAIAAQANVAVIIDEGVGGNTSAIIENEPFETALQRILLPLGLVYKREGDHYLIGKDDPASSMFPMLAETREYRPLHLAPQELAALLPQRFKPYVSVADKRNMIIVEAPPAKLQEIHERLQRFDQPVPQVVLEAIVCVISPESGFRSGLDWGHALTLGDRDLLNLGLAGLTFGGSVTPLGLQNYFNDFAVTSAFVRLLAQEGYLTIRAAPRVMAKDGEKAEISIGRESFFSIQPTLNAQFLFRQDIERVEAGITLNITPVIRGDNITVTIEKAEVSEDIRTKDFNPQINNNPFPVINRRRVATTVNVQDGKTIVIGGLVTRQTVDRVSRIPVLGHCPGIGRMFEIVEKEEKDVEVVIFISPRLVAPPTVAAADDAPPATPPVPWDIQPAAPMPPPAPPRRRRTTPRPSSARSAANGRHLFQSSPRPGSFSKVEPVVMRKLRPCWSCVFVCLLSPPIVAQSERPVVESSGPVKISRQVEYAFRVDPMVHRLEARRGDILPVNYQIIAKDLPTTVIVKTVALRQQDNGVIMPDEEAPPPVPLVIRNPGQYDIDPGKTIDILGEVRLPPGSDANFHSYGLLVKDIGRQLNPDAPAADAAQPRAGIKFITQYLCRADVRVLGVRGESITKLRLESGELLEKEGRPMVRVWIQNPTDAALEYQMRCRIGNPDVGAKRTAFPLVMPIRATVEGPERLIARILPGSRLRMEEMVPFPVFPGEYVLDVELLDGAHVVTSAQFQISVGADEFPAQDATVIQVAQGVTVAPAQIELSLRRGGNRFVAAEFTNSTPHAVDLQLTPQGLGERPFDWLSVRPNTLRLSPGQSRRALISLGPNRDDQSHRFAAVGARVVNADGEVVGDHPLTVALIGRNEEGARLEVAKIRWDPTGEKPAFAVPVKNTGALHLPLRGQMVLTEEGGQPEEVFAGHGRWLLPGASDELRFPLKTALKAGRFELKLKIESGDPAAPFTFSEILQLSE